MIYGYARVSTDGQTLDAQIAALKAAGAEKVYSQKQSGVKSDRVALGRVLAALESGDVLLVTKTAKALGLTVPETLFATADEVIQ